MDSMQAEYSQTGKKTSGSVAVEPKGAEICLNFNGHWAIGSTFPPFAEIQALFPGAFDSISFDTTALLTWDSRFLIIINNINDYAAQKNIPIAIDGLPSGVQRLFQLSSASPEKAPFKPEQKSPSFLETVGDKTTHLIRDCENLLSFTGMISLSYLRLFSGKAQFLKSDFLYFLEECGPSALPIVSLISVLVGIILAFVGAVQLQLFGAEIYIANLVGLGMTREMGAMMAAIIMAGEPAPPLPPSSAPCRSTKRLTPCRPWALNPWTFSSSPVFRPCC